MANGNIVLKMIPCSENIHGHHYCPGPNQKGPGNKISAEIGTVPTRAVSSSKQPRGYRVNGKSNRDDCNTQDIDRFFAEQVLFVGAFPEGAQETIKFMQTGARSFFKAKEDLDIGQHRVV